MLHLKTPKFQVKLYFLEALFVHFTAPLTIIILVDEVDNWAKVTRNIAKTIFKCRKINTELSRKVHSFVFACTLYVIDIDNFVLGHKICVCFTIVSISLPCSELFRFEFDHLCQRE